MSVTIRRRYICVQQKGIICYHRRWKCHLKLIMNEALEYIEKNKQRYPKSIMLKVEDMILHYRCSAGHKQMLGYYDCDKMKRPQYELNAIATLDGVGTKRKIIIHFWRICRDERWHDEKKNYPSRVQSPPQPAKDERWHDEKKNYPLRVQSPPTAITKIEYTTINQHYNEWRRPMFIIRIEPMTRRK